MVTRFALLGAPLLLSAALVACGSKGDLMLPKGTVSKAVPALPRSPAPVEPDAPVPARQP